MTEDLSGTERALRAMLSDRAADAPTAPGLYDTARRHHRRRRTVLVAGTAAAAVVAVGVPALALGDREPSVPAATSAAPIASPAPGSCPVRPGPAAPGLPTQDTVAGSLGADPDAVTAVLRVGWDLLRQRPFEGAPLDPTTARVRLVDRAADGVVVGLVTAHGPRTALGPYAVVTGPRLDQLSAERATGRLYGSSASVPASEIIALAQACGRPRVVVWAPPGSTATMSQITGIRADATVQTESRPVPLRPDGVAVLDRAASPSARLAVTAPGGSTPAAELRVGPPPVAPGCIAVRPGSRECTTVAQAVAAAPGNGDPGQALSTLEQVPVFPVPVSDLRVPWLGRVGDGTVAAAMVTFPSGAGYLWGGVVIPGRNGTFTFSGLIPADQLDRAALVLTVPDAPGGTAVFVPGTARVSATVGGVSRTVTARGGVLLDGGPVSWITATAADGTPLPIVQLGELPGLPPLGN